MEEVHIQDVEITDTMRFMNRDHPRFEFEDETQEGGQWGCDGVMETTVIHLTLSSSNIGNT